MSKFLVVFSLNT